MDLPRSRGSEIYSVVEGRQLDGRKSSRFSLQTSRLLSCTGASAASCPLFAVHFLASVCFGRATSIFSKGFLSADAYGRRRIIICSYFPMFSFSLSFTFSVHMCPFRLSFQASPSSLEYRI